MIAVSQVVAAAVVVLGLVVALGLVVTSGMRGARALAAVGVVLIALGVLSRLAYQTIVDRFLGQMDNERIVSLLALEIAVGGALLGSGLLLLTRAIVTADETAPKRK